MIITDSKNSFILYNDYEKYFRQLTDSEAASVLFAVFAYSKDKTEPNTLSPMAAMVFSFVRDQIDRDTAKYRQMCEKNRKNAKSRYEKAATACDRMQPQPTACLNDNDNDNDIDTDTDNDTDNDTDTDTANDNEQCGGGEAEVSEGDFLAFWRNYPKHNGKREARQAFFEEVRSREDLDRLKELTEKWKRSTKWTEENGRWIMRADRFITDIFPTGDLPPNYEKEEHWAEFFDAAVRRGEQYMNEVCGESTKFFGLTDTDPPLL